MLNSCCEIFLCHDICVTFEEFGAVTLINRLETILSNVYVFSSTKINTYFVSGEGRAIRETQFVLLDSVHLQITCHVVELEKEWLLKGMRLGFHDGAGNGLKARDRPCRFVAE